MPRTRSLDEISVVDGKLIREMSSSKLDRIIANGTERLAHLTARIGELIAEKDACQVRVNRATTLKTELDAARN